MTVPLVFVDTQQILREHLYRNRVAESSLATFAIHSPVGNLTRYTVYDLPWKGNRPEDRWWRCLQTCCLLAPVLGCDLAGLMSHLDLTSY